MIEKEEVFTDLSTVSAAEPKNKVCLYSSSLVTVSSKDENNNLQVSSSLDSRQEISFNISRDRYQTTIESSLVSNGVSSRDDEKLSLGSRKTFQTTIEASRSNDEQKNSLNSRDRSQTTIDSNTTPLKRERRQTMPSRLVAKDEDNQLSSALSELFPSSSSILIEKENDGYYSLDGRQVHTWESLVNLIHVSNFENDEFQLRDSFQKAVHLIGAGNMFKAIETMEIVRLEQLWLDRLVNFSSFKYIYLSIFVFLFFLIRKKMSIDCQP